MLSLVRCHLSIVVIQAVHFLSVTCCLIYIVRDQTRNLEILTKLIFSLCHGAGKRVIIDI